MNVTPRSSGPPSRRTRWLGVNAISLGVWRVAAKRKCCPCWNSHETDLCLPPASLTPLEEWHLLGRRFEERTLFGLIVPANPNTALMRCIRRDAKPPWGVTSMVAYIGLAGPARSLKTSSRVDHQSAEITRESLKTQAPRIVVIQSKLTNS
jgi:hypothetical protein